MASIEFTRGDGAHHWFAMPASSWSAGGHLRFGAKPLIDDDGTDAAAQINQEWDDSAVTLVAAGALLGDGVTKATVPMRQYACYFPPSATNSIPSNGAGRLDLLGEFQWTPLGGDPVTFPADDNKLDCVVYMDVLREEP